ncbi:MAG TPA: RNA polymerase sigma-70 factor [Bacteroidales bacterium]|nr:RNA polymerase sigma-70 factor [Bacteroidales bacterium]
MLNDSEKYLIEAVRNGDYRAFEVLFSTYYPVMCRYAYSMVHSTETSEDLVSDIFVRIWEHPSVLSVNSSLKAYLIRSVHNTCLNYLTRGQKNFINLDAETVERLQNILPQLISEDSSVAFIADELTEKIEEIINNLPEKCSHIFRLSRVNGLSHREIAQKLDISENTVKVQIYRALIKIKESLGDYLQ